MNHINANVCFEEDLWQEVVVYLFTGITYPVPTPVGYRWGRRCQSCETVLTKKTASPGNYRQCQLCHDNHGVGRDRFRSGIL